MGYLYVVFYIHIPRSSCPLHRYIRASKSYARAVAYGLQPSKHSSPAELKFQGTEGQKYKT